MSGNADKMGMWKRVTQLEVLRSPRGHMLCPDLCCPRGRTALATPWTLRGV